MKEFEVKEIIAREVLNKMSDHAASDVLRDVLFDDDNKIDWNKAGESIIKHMPELKMFD